MHALAAETDDAETVRLTKILCFANKLQLPVSAFLVSWSVYIIKNSNVCQRLVLVSFIQNHSAITQLFYMMTSLSLKPLVHDLIIYVARCYRAAASPSWKASQKIFAALAALAQPAPQSPNIFLCHCYMYMDMKDCIVWDL